MLHVSRKMIRAKAEAIFGVKTDDPAMKESFIASSGWVQNLFKLLNYFFFDAVILCCI